MTTIGFRFEEDRIIAPPKRTFLQKLNERQGALVAHIRLNRNEEQAYRRQKQAEQSRQRALSSSSTLTVDSATPSNGSAATDRDPDSQEESDCSSPTDNTEDFSVPYQYAKLPKDRESRRKIVGGMQNFITWKQASYDSDLARPFHISPPQTPQSSHSWSSLGSAPTEMSDEQLEEWLDRPMDAELHRSRKASAASSSASSAASISARPSMSSIGEECIEPPNIILTQEIKRKPLPSPPMEVLPEVVTAEDKPLPAPPTEDVSAEEDNSKPLPIPNELLQEIAFQSHDCKARPFRLSHHVLSDFKSTALPT